MWGFERLSLSVTQIVAKVVNGLCEPPITIRNIVERILLKLKDFRGVQVSYI